MPGIVTDAERTCGWGDNEPLGCAIGATGAAISTGGGRAGRFCIFAVGGDTGLFSPVARTVSAGSEGVLKYHQPTAPASTNATSHFHLDRGGGGGSCSGFGGSGFGGSGFAGAALEASLKPSVFGCCFPQYGQKGTHPANALAQPEFAQTRGLSPVAGTVIEIPARCRA